jgi:hypothetical protein
MICGLLIVVAVAAVLVLGEVIFLGLTREKRDR